MPLQHLFCEKLVLRLHGFDILRRQGGGIVRGAHHRLHGKLREAQVRHVEQIVCEIGVCVGEGAAHIIALPAPGFHELLEFRHDPVIAAVSGVIHPKPVVNLFSAVQGQHHVRHLPVRKFDHVVVNEHTVRGEGEAEVLAPLLFHASCVGNEPFYHVPVHKRLAAEEIHLQVPAASGVGDQEVQGLTAHLEGHQRPLPLEAPLAGEAVGAV